MEERTQLKKRAIKKKKHSGVNLFYLFSGGQSDQGYDSLSKEEERLCSRESENPAPVEGLRQSSELWISYIPDLSLLVSVSAEVCYSLEKNEHSGFKR